MKMYKVSDEEYINLELVERVAVVVDKSSLSSDGTDISVIAYFRDHMGGYADSIVLYCKTVHHYNSRERKPFPEEIFFEMLREERAKALEFLNNFVKEYMS